MSTNVHPHAFHAIRAAGLYNQCGPFAARRYAEKNGVQPALFRLARQLQAVTLAQAVNQ